MLPVQSRLRHRAEFASTLRGSRGVRGNGLLVAHALIPSDSSAAPVQAARAGLVVSRAIGSAVTRNGVKRRLRHLLASRLAALPVGTQLVVRALPGSGAASSAALAAALDAALARAARSGQTTTGARA